MSLGFFDHLIFLPQDQQNQRIENTSISLIQNHLKLNENSQLKKGIVFQHNLKMQEGLYSGGAMLWCESTTDSDVVQGNRHLWANME